MFRVRCHVDVHGGQRGENVGLQERDEYFERRQEHEHGKRQHSDGDEDSISGLEEGIADRRELYNEAVNNYTVRIEQFPDVLVARFFGFRAATLLEFSEEEKRDPDLKALFG